MTISIIRSPAMLVFLAAGCVFSAEALSDESPHWTTTGCSSCHLEPNPADGKALKGDNADVLCEGCHGGRGDAMQCRHLSGISAGAVEVPENLKGALRDGNIVCSTCHDVVYQCERPKPHFALQNKGFLRDRTSRNAEDYCGKCHDSSAYLRLNPHKGVVGSPARPTCLLCHDGYPETSPTGDLIVNFNMQSDLNDICRGCHNTRPHPKSLFSYSKDEWVHLVMPSNKVVSVMSKSEAQTGIELPLDPHSGEVFCATCHNPHEFKVGGEHGSEFKSTENRLRMKNICEACHEK